MSEREMIAMLTDLVKPELAVMGFELIELEYAGKTLRIVIDRPGGVSMDDCVSVTRRIGMVLDASDPISSSYRLEVSSPGLTRRIKAPWEYDHFSGRKVRVQTVSGSTVRGTIKGLDGDRVALVVDGVETSLGLDEILKANLDF